MVGGIGGVRRIAFLIAVLASPTHVLAQDGFAACAVLDVGPDTVRRELLDLSTVFGKPAIEWRQEDYDSLVRLATACDGQETRSGRVSGGRWSRSIEKARTKVLPLAQMSMEVARRASDDPPEKAVLPACERVVETRIFPSRIPDGSELTFGMGFLAMPLHDVDLVEAHIHACIDLAREWVRLKGSYAGLDDKSIVGVGADLLTRLAFVREARTVWSETRNDGATRIEIHGTEVPPTLAGTSTRELLAFYDKWRSESRPSRAGVARIIEMVEQIRATAPGLVDEAYLTEVMNGLNAEIYRR